MLKLNLFASLILCITSVNAARCTNNNCFNALSKNVQAQSFCSSYLSTPGVPIPTYLSNCGGSPARVSSACSCIPSATTSSTIPSATCPAPSTITVSATITVTATSTSPQTCSTSAVPACIAFSVSGERSLQFFVGRGVRTPTDNPATGGVAPDYTTYSQLAFYNDCEAISACAKFARASQGSSATIDLHYLIAEGYWECWGYHNSDRTNYFIIQDVNVGRAYGYAIE